MYIDKIKVKTGKKVHVQILLRESFREPGAPRSQVKHRTLLNLTHHDPKDIAAIKLALKHKNDLAKLKSLAKTEIKITQGLSVGAVWALWCVAQRVGLVSVLGGSQEARRVLWQVFARLINQGSRLSAVRLAGEHAACEILGLSSFDENDLYDSLDWLDARQAKIEDALYQRRNSDGAPQLFLYDVTSSYLEGTENEYAAWGYNRDKKKGKLQIVVGLLSDGSGNPLSIEVFEGNTQDTQTVCSQVRKLAERFGAGAVTLVGDRGMLKTAQIAELSEESFHYLTAITKPQIESLLKKGVFQLGLFEEKLCEVRDGGVRYILRRNPARAAEIAMNRADKFRSLASLVLKKNDYLALHLRADIKVALRDVLAYAKKLRISDWVLIEADGRAIKVEQDAVSLAQVSRLDGCYALKTDVPTQAADAATLHTRYKDLAQVEQAFREMKTGHLEVRPVYVRTAAHTRAHVFIVMLAYLLRRELDAAWRKLNLTVEEGLSQLSSLCSEEISFGDSSGYLSVPIPRESLARLFTALSITPPPSLPPPYSPPCSH
jgi:hypothetical protein